MQKRVYAIIVILLVLPTMALQEETAQFESPIVKSSDGLTSTAKEAIIDQPSTLQHTTKPNPTSSLNVEVASNVYSNKDRQVLCCPESNYLVVRNRIYLEGADLGQTAHPAASCGACKALF